MSFEKLMDELSSLSTDQETMAKALPADDGKDEKKIQAAAGEGGSDGDADNMGGEPDGDADDEGKEKPMAKSFKFTLEDGTEVEAQDGAELVKALSDRVSAVESDNGQLTKALETAVTVIKGYSPLIKSLQDQIAKLSGEGRGRKTVVSVIDKPAPGTSTLAKSEPAGVSPDAFFAKALVAQKEGRLSGIDIAMAESCMNRGEAIPPNIVARVML